MLDGKVEVRFGRSEEKFGEKEEGTVVVKHHKLSLQEGSAEKRPSPVKMEEDEIIEAKELLPFTVEKELKRRPPPPDPDRELDGP